MKRTAKTLLMCTLLIFIFLLFSACGEKAGNSIGTDGTEATKDNTPPATQPQGTADSNAKTDENDPPEILPTREEYISQTRLQIYGELPEDIRRNYDYKVTVTQGGKSASIPVYNHTMEYHVPDRSVGGDLYRRFSQFAFSGEQVRVDIKVNRDFETYTVFPSAKKFKTEFKDGVISVFLDKPDYFGIRLDNSDNSILSVFADYPEYPGDIPSRDDPDVIYIEGWHDTETGILEITEPETTLYIAPGAVLNSRVNITGDYSKVIGRGVILDPFEDIYSYDIRKGGTEGRGTKLCMLCADGLSFDGPVLMDARCFNLLTDSNSTGASVKNYKALSSMMTSDGITGGSYDSTYEHCWIYCADNGLVISSTEGQTYKDIAIGTTCAALFPQVKTKNIELDGIYVFRSNDGIINNRYNNSTNSHEISINIKDLDCMDCTNVCRFYQGGNMGTLPKTISFDGISLPKMSNSSDPHLGLITDYPNLLVEFTNPNSLFSENYTLSFKNVYIDGVAIIDASQVSMKGTEYKNTVTFSNDGTYTPVARAEYTVNHKAQGKVYIGTLQMSFKEDILLDGDSFMLPSSELQKMLRTDKMPSPTVKNGIEYVKHTELTASGAVKEARVENGDLYLTPVYSGKNLLLPDEGRISQISEALCYRVDLVAEDNDGDYIYYLHDYNNYYNGGFSIMLTEEIKKYGAGDYEFKFRVRCAENSSIVCCWEYDNGQACAKSSTSETIITSWKSITMELKVTEEMLENEMFAVSVFGGGANIEYFAVKELELIKK